MGTTTCIVQCRVSDRYSSYLFILILLLGEFGDYGITIHFYVSPALSGTKGKLVVYKSINGIPVFRFLAFLNLKRVREQDELVQAMKARKTLGLVCEG